jgi:hypothetical protein
MRIVVDKFPESVRKKGNSWFYVCKRVPLTMSVSKAQSYNPRFKKRKKTCGILENI